MQTMLSSRFNRSLRYCALALAAAALPLVVEAQVSQAPLSLTEGVPPNMIFTLDDSGSMCWAFAPDSQSETRKSRRAKSSAFNPMYYDPAVTYVAPKVVDTDGKEVQLSTSFEKAYHTGFNTDRGHLSLVDGYKVSWSYDLSSSFPKDYGYASSCARYLAENPSVDFDIQQEFTLISGSPQTYSIAGRSYTFTRSSNNNCSVIPSKSGISCSRKSGNTYEYEVDLTKSGVPAYYYTFDSSVPGCKGDSAKADDNCYKLIFVSETSGPGGTDERQNFANWYSFYRNRALATLSAASLAFYDLSSSVRLTWQGLGNCTTLNGGNSGKCKDNKFRPYEAAHKGQFYAYLSSVQFSSTTYLPAATKRAGEFLQTDTAWQKFPNSTGNTDENTYSCRPSYHVMMTDGMWNSTTDNPKSFRHDGTSFDLPLPFEKPEEKMTYDGQHPFNDSTAKTLADLTMHYWATDLREDLHNRVPPFMPFKSGVKEEDYWDPRNDPASWQHMVNFIMGLGLSESLKKPGLEWEGGTHSGVAYGKLKAGDSEWPAAAENGANFNAGHNVYDLWHAAINSRGEFFSVDNPDAMVQAFRTILNRIAERTGTASSPALNSGVVLEEDGGALVSYSYQANFYSDENWAGDVKGFTKTRQLNADTGQWEIDIEEDWSARALLEQKAWQSRNITIANAAGTALQAFSWANAGDASEAGTLAFHLKSDPDKVESPCNSAACAEKRLNFIRGDRSEEGALFRVRKSVLGDFVASRPVSVRGARLLVGPAQSIEGVVSNYKKFYQDQEARAQNKPRIYVGGNDGMLHGFDARTGEETFAFIPTAVFPNLYRLTGKTYNHHFYVDGSPVVADVYIERAAQKAWRTVLVGTLRAGGKGLFALDITDPDNVELLWEFGDDKISAIDGEKNKARLGFSFPQPTIARLHNGKWAVVTGNGYDSEGSTHGKAALIIIDMATGALIKSIEAQGESGLANGLSSPRLVDINVDGVADYAYAGDLQGNLWRFNLTPAKVGENINPFARSAVESASAEAHFKLSYGGKPLFKAVASDGSRQPITAPPAVIRHPSRYGHLVIVATGKYFEVGDKSGTTEKQSLYGIWDTNTRSISGNETGPGSLATGTLARSGLQAQSYEVDPKLNTAGRTLSQTNVKWAIPPQGAEGAWVDNDGHKYGWYFDLSLPGEMSVESMLFLGQTLFFQTLVPNDDPCDNGAENWSHAIDPYTGGRTRHHAFKDIRHTSDTNTPVTAVIQAGEGGLTAGLDPTGDFVICTGESCLNVDPDPQSIGRQSWRRVGQ